VRQRSTRIYVDDQLETGQELLLPPHAYHHAVDVLRHPVGSLLWLFNGDGTEHEARLVAVARREARVRLLSSRRPAVESALDITLVQAVLKGDRMDYALQKAVELGVTRIRPLFAEHAALRPTGDRLEKKMGHWRRVIIGACEQSGRTRIPALLPPLDTGGVLSALDGPAVLLAPSARTALGAIPRYRKITVLVGPEGGFSRTELAKARGQGVPAAGLGPRTLRAETAAVAALAILQSLWGDLASTRAPDCETTGSGPGEQPTIP